MKHLVLTKLIDNRIHNLKGLIHTTDHCIEADINTSNNIILKESFEKELDVLQKQRQVVFDNFMLFNVK